jgi:hypothetical protein
MIFIVVEGTIRPDRSDEWLAHGRFHPGHPERGGQPVLRWSRSVDIHISSC